MVYSSHHPVWAVTVDICVFSVRSGSFQVLLVERGEEPFAGRLALPGGFVQPGEGLGQAALRELHEETGISLDHLAVEQLRSYGDPGRDPRPERVLSVAHLALVPDLPEALAGTDASGARWVGVEEALGMHLAFDHDEILREAVQRARGRLEYSPMAVHFCEPRFTIGQLQAVYEAVWGRALDTRNFRRKVLAVPGLLRETDELSSGPGRPGRKYEWGGATRIHPPLVID